VAEPLRARHALGYTGDVAIDIENWPRSFRI